MLNAEQLRSKLNESNLLLVSKKSGCDYKALLRFMKGDDPRLSLAEKLCEYLERK
jgi:hypothetical protein